MNIYRCRLFYDNRRGGRGRKRQIVKNERYIAQTLADYNRALGAAACDTVSTCRCDSKRCAVDCVAAACRGFGD